MPLSKTLLDQEHTKVLIWQIEEDFEELRDGLSLTQNCQNRLRVMKSAAHKRGFLSVRHLLKAAGYAPCDVCYDDNGKPHLRDGNFISITHSHQYAGVVISAEPVGIDIEKQREKILRIARKFTSLKEYKTVANDSALIRKLTIVWSAKEAVYKAMGIAGLEFLNHIFVENFLLNSVDKKIRAEVNYHNKRSSFKLMFFEFNGFTCVYALPSKLS